MQDNAEHKLLISSVDEILKNFPDVDNTEELKDKILQVIQKVINTEREACAVIAEDLDDGESANKAEYNDVQVATKFSLKAVAHEIARRIRGQSEP